MEVTTLEDIISIIPVGERVQFKASGEMGVIAGYRYSEDKAIFYLVHRPLATPEGTKYVVEEFPDYVIETVWDSLRIGAELQVAAAKAKQDAIQAASTIINPSAVKFNTAN